MDEPKKRNQYAYDKEQYDHVHLQLPKGKKGLYQRYATRKGESLNAFIYRAMKNQQRIDIGLEPFKRNPQS